MPECESGIALPGSARALAAGLARERRLSALCELVRALAAGLAVNPIGDLQAPIEASRPPGPEECPPPPVGAPHAAHAWRVLPRRALPCPSARHAGRRLVGP